MEGLVFGRTESGETLSTLRLRDTIRLRRGGRLILHDSIRLHGDANSQLGWRAGAAGARAPSPPSSMRAPDAVQCLPALRLALADADAGASAWDGILLARIVAPDGQALRRSIIAALATLRPAPLPRVLAIVKDTPCI